MADIMVIGQAPCTTSQGPIVAGEMIRLPLEEALRLTTLQSVTLAPWEDQQLPNPVPRAARRRYRRRDLRADK